MDLTPGKYIRRSRSFALRQGRLTPGQENAMQTLWPKYGIDFDERDPKKFDLKKIFPKITNADQSNIWLEIGFGNGESLVQMAEAFPERQYIGIEVHTPGVGHCLMQIESAGIDNCRVVQADAVEVLSKAFDAGALQGVQVYFPDPWHKKRHHKRRIISTKFVELVTEQLASSGVLHAATDWAEYAEWMAEVLESSELINQAPDGQTTLESPAIGRPETKFERRGKRLGHDIYDFVYQKR